MGTELWLFLLLWLFILVALVGLGAWPRLRDLRAWQLRRRRRRRHVDLASAPGEPRLPARGVAPASRIVVDASGPTLPHAILDDESGLSTTHLRRVK